MTENRVPDWLREEWVAATVVFMPGSRGVNHIAKDEKEIEAEIQAKGLTAPRLNPAHIDAQIVAEQFHIFPGTVTTVCCLTLQNGYTVIGKSSPASPENFDRELGQKIARADARGQIWALEGYLLRSKLAGE